MRSVAAVRRARVAVAVVSAALAVPAPAVGAAGLWVRVAPAVRAAVAEGSWLRVVPVLPTRAAAAPVSHRAAQREVMAQRATGHRCGHLSFLRAVQPVAALAVMPAAAVAVALKAAVSVVVVAGLAAVMRALTPVPMAEFWGAVVARQPPGMGATAALPAVAAERWPEMAVTAGRVAAAVGQPVLRVALAVTAAVAVPAERRAVPVALVVAAARAPWREEPLAAVPVPADWPVAVVVAVLVVPFLLLKVAA